MNQITSISHRLQLSLSKVIADTQPGDRLPSEPDLARQLGVSRATLREAMRAFETQGVIRRRQGSGTFVVQPSGVIESGLEILESIETLAKRIGLPVSMGELEVFHQPANEEESQALHIPANSMVVHLSRVILAEERPVAYLIDTIPDDILKPEDLSESFTGSILDLFLQRGFPNVRSSRCEISAVSASHDVARFLGIQRGSVLLHFVNLLYDAEGRVVDYAFSYFLPGYFRFHVIRRVG